VIDGPADAGQGQPQRFLVGVVQDDRISTQGNRLRDVGSDGPRL